MFGRQSVSPTTTQSAPCGCIFQHPTLQVLTLCATARSLYTTDKAQMRPYSQHLQGGRAALVR